VLKRKKVGVRYTGNSYSDNRWSVYRCIVFETECQDRFYVLTCGEWYEVEKGFVERVNSRVKSLASTALRLPSAADKRKRRATTCEWRSHRDLPSWTGNVIG